MTAVSIFHRQTIMAYMRLIENTGRFSWGGSGFSGSAKEVTISVEGADGIPVLRAILNNGDGGEALKDINLGERIQNHDGQFVFA